MAPPRRPVARNSSHCRVPSQAARRPATAFCSRPGTARRCTRWSCLGLVLAGHVEEHRVTGTGPTRTARAHEHAGAHSPAAGAEHEDVRLQRLAERAHPGVGPVRVRKNEAFGACSRVRASRSKDGTRQPPAARPTRRSGRRVRSRQPHPLDHRRASAGVARERSERIHPAAPVTVQVPLPESVSVLHRADGQHAGGIEALSRHDVQAFTSPTASGRPSSVNCLPDVEQQESIEPAATELRQRVSVVHEPRSGDSASRGRS